MGQLQELILDLIAPLINMTNLVEAQLERATSVLDVLDSVRARSPNSYPTTHRIHTHTVHKMHARPLMSTAFLDAAYGITPSVLH